MPDRQQMARELADETDVPFTWYLDRSTETLERLWREHFR